MKLYFFNPDHDIALACHDANYTSPKLVCLMERDLAMLPMWYAESGSALYNGEGVDSRFLRSLKELFPIDISLLTDCSTMQVEPQPWGWDLKVMKRFRQMGVDNNLLPDDPQLEHVRELSGRALAVGILDRLRAMEHVIGESSVLTMVEECRSYVRKFGKVVFKSPWSSSGRGLRWCYDSFTDKEEGWCKNVIAAQGYLTASPIYRCKQDFAMEFWCDKRVGASFSGYSIFDTQEGRYAGNVLMSQQRMEQILAASIPEEVLLKVRAALEEQFGTLVAPYYTGPVGVDMMICENEEGRTVLHPCVEINLRMTMGMLAKTFFDRYVSERSEGFFRIEYVSAPNRIRELHHEASKQCAPLIRDGRLIQGYLSLIPVNPQTRYRVYVTLTSCTSDATNAL